jgi:hypothetical protein
MFLYAHTGFDKHKRIRNGKAACTKTHEREKRKRVLKVKSVRRVLGERLDSLLLTVKEKRLARLPAYLHIYSLGLVGKVTSYADVV